MSDVVSKQVSRSEDRSNTRVRKRKNSSASSASDSGLSQKRRNACSKDKRNKSRRRSSSSGSSSSSSSTSRNSTARRQLKAKASSNMSQKYSQSSRDRRNGGVQVPGGRDTYIREQRSYSQRESRYKVERYDRTFSNRMYVENQGGMRGMKYAFFLTSLWVLFWGKSASLGINRKCFILDFLYLEDSFESCLICGKWWVFSQFWKLTAFRVATGPRNPITTKIHSFFNPFNSSTYRRIHQLYTLKRSISKTVQSFMPCLTNQRSKAFKINTRNLGSVRRFKKCF